MPEPADELFACPPDDFVAARNALVRQLRAEGEREMAAEVAARRRPTPGAWALNQVAREEPGLITELVEAAAELRAATEQALNGDASALHPAQTRERAAMDAVVLAGERQLHELGGAVSETTRRRMVETLRAAGTDPDAAALVRSGRLSTDLRAPSLGLDGLTIAPGGAWSTGVEPGSSTHAEVAPRKMRPEDQLAERRAAKRAELERAAQGAEDEARQAEDRAAAARASAERAEEVASVAEHAASRARDRAERARAKADRV